MSYTDTTNGIIYNLSGTNATVDSYDNTVVADVTIPETIEHEGTTYTVTAINASAFLNWQLLTSITVPASVNTIGDSAFAGTNLTTIKFGHTDSLPTIGSGVFDSGDTIYVDTAAKNTTAITSLSEGTTFVFQNTAVIVLPHGAVEKDHYYYAVYTVSNQNKNAIHMRLYDHDRNLISEKTQSFTRMNALKMLEKIGKSNSIMVGNHHSTPNVDIAFLGLYQQGWNNKQQNRLMRDINKDFPNVYSNATAIYTISANSPQYIVDGEDKKNFYLDHGIYVFDHSTLTDPNDEILFRDISENGGDTYTPSTNVWFEGTIGSTHAYKILKIDETTPDLEYYTVNGGSSWYGSIYNVNDRTTFYVKVAQNMFGKDVFAMSTLPNGTYHSQPRLNITTQNYFFNMTDPTNAGFNLLMGTTVDDATSIVDSSFIDFNGTPGSKGANVVLDVSGYTGNQLYYFEDSSANMGYIPVDTTTFATVDASYNVKMNGNVVLLNDVSFENITLTSGNKYLFTQDDVSNKNKFLAFATEYNASSHTSAGVVVMGSPGYAGAYTAIIPQTSGLQYFKVENYDGVYKPDYSITAIPAYLLANTAFSMDVTKNLVSEIRYTVNYDDLSGALTTGSLSFTPPSSISAFEFTVDNKVFKTRMVYDNPTVFTVEISGTSVFINDVEKPKLYMHSDATFVFDQSHVSNVDKRIVFADNGSNPAFTGASVYGVAGSSDGYSAFASTATDTSFTSLNYSAGSADGSVFVHKKPDFEYKVGIQTNLLGQEVFAFTTDMNSDDFVNQVDLDISQNALYYFDTSHPSNSGKTLVFGLDPDNAESNLNDQTIYSFASQGTAGAYVFLDLRAYVFPTV